MYGKDANKTESESISHNQNRAQNRRKDVVAEVRAKQTARRVSVRRRLAARRRAVAGWGASGCNRHRRQSVSRDPRANKQQQNFPERSVNFV